MRTLTGILVLAMLLAPLPAGAEADLGALRERREQALARAEALVGRVDALARTHARLERRTMRSTAFLLDAYRADLALRGEISSARSLMDERANIAYRAGPALFFQALVDVASIPDLLEAREIIERTFVSDIGRMADLLDRRSRLRDVGRRLDRRRTVLRRRESRLAEVRDAMAARLAEAERLALRAGRRMEALRDARRELAAAADRAAGRTALLTGDASLDGLLALLGPHGGRGCDLPHGLRRTGGRFSGVASWYGWDFAGNPTASGAIYDPRLFTAAHRTLPLNTFLFVRHGARCATVLVNDRGPYIEGRVLDLSQGAAEYLGVGLNVVQAEILAVAG